jgi:DNA-binding response OmpR family regulator
MKVLLVEDDASLREGMSDVISELAEVRSTGSVDEALAALRQERFELVLTDLRITGSGQGGRSIVEAAQRQLQAVVIVSAASDEDIQRALNPLEADAVLAKPFQLEEMMALVERFLGVRRELERLSRGPPPEAGWTQEAPGVQVLRLAGAGIGQPLTWIRMEPGASYAWTHHQGRAGVLVAEGDLEVGGQRQSAPHYLFLSAKQLPTARTEKGCLAVSLAMRG